MTEWKNTMLISPKRVKESGELNVNVEDRAIASSIRIAQDIYLRDAIGKDLLDKLKLLVFNKIDDNDGSKIDDTENIAYKTLLDDYIGDALVYKTVVNLAIRKSYELRNMGLVKNYDTNVQASGIDDIKYLMDYQNTMWNDALNRIVEFLCENKEAIPESNFVCGECKPNTKFANVNIWLGK